MTDTDKGEATDSLLQTLNAMVRMQAESVRLQRLLVERLLGPAALPEVAATEAPAPAEPQPASRGARYYQSTPERHTPSFTPQQVDLLCRLQAMRDAGDLILQFGPHKGTTLAQVALHHPAYIRELASRAQRPAVRAAAARILQALEAQAPPPRRAAPRTTAAARTR